MPVDALRCVAAWFVLYTDTVRGTQQTRGADYVTIRRRALAAQITDLEAALEEARRDRGVYHEQLEAQKAKQKARRKEWADERKRLLRCLETQTRHNSVHLQVRSRARACDVAWHARDLDDF